MNGCGGSVVHHLLTSAGRGYQKPSFNASVSKTPVL